MAIQNDPSLLSINFFKIALPMPLLDPVIKAVFPVNINFSA